MNELNYATKEARQRLVEAGIVLKTDTVFASKDGCEYQLIPTEDVGRIGGLTIIPAPSMAEVWRELPEMISYDGVTFYLTLQRLGEISEAGYESVKDVQAYKSFENTNPTDSLIDLLIWVRSQK